MSTISDVRSSEKKLRDIIEELRHADERDLDRLSIELRNVGDDYAKTVRDLEFERPRSLRG